MNDYHYFVLFKFPRCDTPTDVIPVELGQLDNLEELDLSGNKLTGEMNDD